MEVLKNLRPAEALYLLDMAKKESITEEATLAAIIMYLVSEGFITTSPGKWFTVTEKGKREILQMRDYERGFIKAMELKALDELLYIVEELLYASDDFNFKNIMVKNGFLKKKYIPKKFLFIQWTIKKCMPADKFNQVIQELEKLKERIFINDVEQKRTDTYMISMSYAFPSLSINNENGLSKFCKRVVDSF